jgi:hypothetical protein
MSSSERLTLYGLILLGLGWLLGCQAMMAPITEAGRIPPGHARATIQVQLPAIKGMGGFATQATNDLRNVTLPAKMRLTVTGLDIDTPIEPSGSYQNPIPLATTQASVSMIVPLGRNLIITAAGLTVDGRTIGSSVVKGVFSALVDQGTTVATVNRLTTPVAEAMEAILAKQSLGPDDQRRSRNLMLGYDAPALQLFVQQTLLGGTGNQQTDLQRLADGRLVKHPGLVNGAALAKYVWERAGVPPNATFLSDDLGGGAFLTPGRVQGVITGVRPGIPVTILVDDPVSKPVTVEGAQAFTVTAVRPGSWRVHAVASGYKAVITHFAGTSTAPAFYDTASVASNGDRPDQDFTMSPLPAVVAAVTPGRGPVSPSVTNPAFVDLDGQDFGDAQDGSSVVFQDQGSGATVAANQIETWSNKRIRVAVPTLTGGNYRVRVDRPTINPGEFVLGTTQASYGAGSWGRLYAAQGVPASGGTAAWWAMSARNDDLHVRGMTLVGADTMLQAYQPTQINLGTGGVVPTFAFTAQNTTTLPGTAAAVHPDGRTTFVWSTGTALMTRTFGTSGTPLSAAVTLVPTSESDQTGIHPESAAYDDAGVLHVAYLAKSPDVMRPLYRRYRIDGLGVPTAVSAPVRLDTSSAGTGTQDAPRLRLGRGGHVAVTWVDRRTGVAAHYVRLVMPDGTVPGPEIVRSNPVQDLAVDSKGEMALCSYGPNEQKLCRFGSAATLLGETVVGRWDVAGGNRDGPQRLTFDHNDHLLVVGLSTYTYWDTRYNQNWTTWVLSQGGYVAGATGYVADSWRGTATIEQRYPVLYYDFMTPVCGPMSVGPDGTLSFIYSGGNFIQYGWF